MKRIALNLVVAALLQGIGAAVENPSFEAGLEGWGKAPNVSIDAAVAHLGTKSACIVVGDPKTENVYITRSVPIEGGCRYRAECFVRTENVRTAEGKDSSVGAGMIIEWADEKGTYLGWGASTYNNFGTRDWFKVESGLLRPPAAATRASVYLCLRGTGKAWFDDFLLAKIDESVQKCAPMNGAELTSNTPEFTWKSCVGVTNYVLRLSQDPGFTGNGVLEHNVGGFTNFQLECPLAPGIWYWKVCAAGMEDREAWSFRHTAPVQRDCLPPLVKDSAARVVSDKDSFVVRVKDAGERRPSLTFHGVKGTFAGVDGDGLFKYVFESPGGGWPPGLTTGEVLAVDAAGNSRKTLLFLINSAKPENSVVIGKDGRYHENGKPVFPLGIYEVATNYLAEVKSAGFDVVHLYRWESSRDNMACREYLDACRAAGLRVFVGFDRRSIMADDREHVAQRIAVLASHPALFCWYLYDEPEVTRQFVAPDRLAAVADFIRRLDPHHPVVMSTWGNAAYRRAWDSHWTQAYGNPSEAYRELEKQKLRLGDSPITLLVNCNDDKQAAARRDGKLLPNVKFGRDRDHLRACAFLGIVKGCNGLFWWWFAKDSTWYYSASQCPDAWRDLSAVVHEVAALRSAVASAESVVTGECGTPDARVLWWNGAVGGKWIIIMVNTADRPVSVPQILGYGPLTLGRYEVKIIRRLLK